MKILLPIATAACLTLLLFSGCKAAESAAAASPASTDYGDGTKTISFASSNWALDDYAKYYWFDKLAGSTTNGTINYNPNVTVTWQGEGGSASDNDGVLNLAVHWENNVVAGPPVGKDAKVELGSSSLQYLLTSGTANGVNASNAVFTMRIFVPTAIQADGQMGLKLYMKDTAYKAQFGPWVSVGSLVAGWNTLTWTIATDTPNYTDAGYDVTKALVLGIEFAQNGATLTAASGDFKIDWVNLTGHTINP